VLQYYEGLTQAEIASTLGCREGTVASLVHRGLAQLRRVVDL
jgi:DNA-directed RNA polymerase specialized sigma24 family protein